MNTGEQRLVIELREEFIKQIKFDWLKYYSDFGSSYPEDISNFLELDALSDTIAKKVNSRLINKEGKSTISKNTVSKYLTSESEVLTMQKDKVSLLRRYLGFDDVGHFTEYRKRLSHKISKSVNEYNTILADGSSSYRSGLFAYLIDKYKTQKIINIDIIGIKQSTILKVISEKLTKYEGLIKVRAILYSADSSALHDRKYFEDKTMKKFNRRIENIILEWEELLEDPSKNLEAEIKFTETPLFSYVRIQDDMLIVLYTVFSGEDRPAILINKHKYANFFESHNTYFDKAFNDENENIHSLEEEKEKIIELKKNDK